MLIIGLSSNPGGVETCTINAINSGKYDKTKIDFINSSTKKLAFQDELEKKYTIYKIPNYYDYSKEYSKELTKIVKDNNYDVIYINLCSTKHLEHVEVSSKYSKAKLILHAHCICDNSYKTKEYLTSVSNLRYACSREAGDSFFLPDSYKIITPVISNNFVMDNKRRTQFRKKLGLTDNIVLGQVGMFCDKKNQIFSLKVLEELLKINSKYRLLLVGKTNEEVINYIDKNKLNNYVITTGSVQNVNDYLNIMDVFLFPSKSEAYGMALVEAQYYSNMFLIASNNVSTVTNVSGRVNYVELDVNKWVNLINKSL